MLPLANMTSYLKKPLVVASACFVLIAFCFSVYALHEDVFLGAKNCGECHKKQYELWIKSPHAKAFDSLPDDKKNDLACLWCHSTDAKLNFKKYKHKAVQCEVCHGTSAEDAFGNIAENFVQIHKSRMKKPTEELCRTCHSALGSPSVGKFDYEEKLKLIKHWNLNSGQ